MRWSHLTYPLLTQRQREYILGAVLGDDALSAHGQSLNARLVTCQSLDHKPYLFWKYHLLENFTLSPPRVIQSPRYDRIHQLVRFHTRATPEITILYKLCYPNGRKFVSLEWLQQLSAFSLAVWYMDDGTYAPQRDFSVLYTGAFSFREQQLIIKYLKMRWGITGCVIQRNRRQWCLRFSRLGTQQFLKIIRPHIESEVPSMRYKLGYPDYGWLRPIQDCMNRYLHAWQSSDDDLLRTWYGHLPTKELSRRLDRTPNAIYMRVTKLGVALSQTDRVSDGQGIYTFN